MNRNIIITGASRGIGRAIAEAFAAESAYLFISARNEGTLQKAAAELQAGYPSIQIKAKAADLSIKQQAVDLGKWINDNCDYADVLVNNAGSYLPGNISNEADGVLETMIHTNLYSAYNLTRILLPRMMAEKKGYIFNICSTASLEAYSNGGSYSISKFALLGFSKNLREELKPYNIKVSAVCPGAVFTDSWTGFDNSDNRIMEANDIATMIVAATKLSPAAVAEDIVLRPQLGDL